MMRQPLITCALVPAALFTLGFLKAASADVAVMDEFTVTRSGIPVFDDKFSAGLPLVGGTGAVLPAGTTFSDEALDARLSRLSDPSTWELGIGVAQGRGKVGSEAK